MSYKCKQILTKRSLFKRTPIFLNRKKKLSVINTNPGKN